MRENVPKVIFLITDGSQNPTEDSRGNLYDPVASSQPLVDLGIKIFAIGVGNTSNNINLKELSKIARSERQVRVTASAADLATADFVKEIAKETCSIIRKFSFNYRITKTGPPLDPRHLDARRTGIYEHSKKVLFNMIGREYLHCKICAFIFFIVAYTGMSFNF